MARQSLPLSDKVLTPKGSWTVAAGEAAARRSPPTRNSWNPGTYHFLIAPEGRRILNVRQYIARQAEHHKKENFKSELLRTLSAHGVEFDEKYVFD